MGAPRKLSSAPEWAHECPAPSFARKKRASGTRALGLSYERKLARALPPGTLHGQWFIYSEQGRVGYCQPDFLLRGRSELAVLEAKLTDIEAAEEQLRALYAPVLGVCYGKKVLSVVVSRSLARCPAHAEVCDSLAEALQVARCGRLPVLHWIGTGRL